MAELSQSTKKLIQRYQAWMQSIQPKEGIACVHVDEVASQVASFYEKIREVVDWREEHLLRKAAIDRILKRRLLLGAEDRNIAQSLVFELIRGGHFPNNSIPEVKIETVQKIIDKYVFFLENSPKDAEKKSKIPIYDWALEIAACEIEETLAPPLKEEALIDYMAESMNEIIEVKEGVLNEEEKKNQVYIAVQLSLFKLDPAIISYHLLKRRYPDWADLPKSLLENLAQNIYFVWENTQKELNHPLAQDFYIICEKKDTPYLILGDIILKDLKGSKENLASPEILESKIKEAYRERLKKLKSKINRAAIYGTISIFLTKMLAALAIEIPYDRYVTGQLNYSALGANILIPPFLMFLLVMNIKPPSKQNAQKVIMEVMKIAYAREKKEAYTIKPSPKKGIVLNAMITGFYFLSFVASFGLMVWTLQKLHFGFPSQIIFVMFFSLIFFAGVKIKERAKELTVEEEKGRFGVFILDIFSMPLIQLGRWLSGQWAKYNIIMILLNSLIEMPLQVFIEFLEQWRNFLKEKKEKIH